MMGRGQEVTVKIRTEYDGAGAQSLSRALESLQQQVSAASRSAQSLSSSFSGFASLFGAGAFGGVVGGALVAGATAFASALSSAANAAMGLGAQLVHASMSMQQMQLGLAAVLGAWYELRDAQGRTITGIERYNALLGMSRALMQEIRDEANRTILSTGELTELVQTSLGFTFGRGLDERQTVRFVSAVAQYGRLMGLDTPMIMQEIRALTGAAPLRTSQIALALGITQQEIELAGETFYNALMRKFSALSELAAQAEQRFDTQWSTFQSKLREVMADLGTGLERGAATLLHSANQILERLQSERVFARIGWILGVLVQEALNWAHRIYEKTRRFVTGFLQAGEILWIAVSHAVNNLLHRMGAVGNWIRGAAGTLWQGAQALFERTPFGQGIREAQEMVRTIRALWDLSGKAVFAQEGPSGVQARRRTPPPAGESTDRATRETQRERERRLREQSEALRIVGDLRGQRVQDAWNALYGVLSPENAAWVVPLMTVLENQMAAAEAGKILERIQADTTPALRTALAAQAWETAQRTRQGLVERREEALAAARERARDQAMREAAQRRASEREILRRLYGALGDEDALLRLEYEERRTFYQESGYGFLAPILAGIEVYLPAQRQRQQEQARQAEQFMERLREAGAAARAQQQRHLERRLRRGLISPMEFVVALRRLFPAQPLPEGALGAFEGALMDEVESRLPEQGLFEPAEAYRARWLAALHELKTASGQWLQSLLHPEQLAQVMEGFDALALQFEQRFIERTESRWRRFVAGLAEQLQSGIGNAFVQTLERVFRNLRSVGDAVRDLFGNILQMIRQTVAQILYERVFKHLVEQLVGAVLGALGGGGSGGAKLTLGGVLASIGVGLLTGWVGKIFGLQQGGRAGAGRAYLVGERGAELFIPQADGVVYPHTYLRKLIQPQAHTGTVAITVYVNDTGDIDLARRVARAIERQGVRW